MPEKKRRLVIPLAIALIGLALATVAVVWLGASKIFNALITLGWVGFCWVLLWQLAVYGVLGVAWWLLGPGVSVPIVIWARLVREGGQNCLPFSEIGGLVFGARALVLGGAEFARAAASSVLDVVTEAIGIVPFLTFGLIVLANKQNSSFVLMISVGLAVLLLGGALAFVSRARLARLFRRGLTRLMSNWTRNAPGCACELERTIQDGFHRRWRVASASGMHFFTWCLGAGNIWIAYHLLGAHIKVVDALAIESMLSGVLSVGFLVPAGLGVQEVSYIGLGAAFGLSPHLSLSLSFIRRARDISLGIPALVLWQLLEARKLRRESVAE
jgi:putative membrane protein